MRHHASHPQADRAALLSDAQAYLERGWSCVPIRSANGAKKPLVRWKPYQDRPSTQAELTEWFGRSLVNGIGIITGPVSGALAIRDFDADAAYQCWAERNPALAKTLPTVKTGRGFHVYANSNLSRTIKLGDGEYRSGPTISLAPRSRHHSGAQYQWIIPLPAGPLPQVEHIILIGADESEKAQAIGSDVSAVSDFSDISDTYSTPASVIQLTMPKGPGERNRCILNLARGLKFNCGLANASADVLREHVRQWHRLVLPVITTKLFDETWMDFLHAFDRARHPLGLDLVDAVRLKLDEQPEAAASYDSHAARQLVGLCHALAVSNRRDGEFFLSSHDAARLGITQPTAWRLLRMLEKDGVIQQTEPGNQRRATRYRYLT